MKRDLCEETSFDVSPSFVFLFTTINNKLFSFILAFHKQKTTHKICEACTSAGYPGHVHTYLSPSGLKVHLCSHQHGEIFGDKQLLQFH